MILRHEAEDQGEDEDEEQDEDEDEDEDRPKIDRRTTKQRTMRLRCVRRKV
ncbi:MAG: hypothetical protein AB8B52_11535 [Winogradskyella sp.]|uniref:hypothetical protein n=1 Tax=Winogradskyella sp. TaxID=1883156 RepID=UPI00385A07E5